MTTVYVSATMLDLKAHREAVATICRRLGLDVIAMESYPADPRRPLDKCLEDVENSDIYIGLFAFRYGYVPQGERMSITESEYQRAFDLSKPCLIFILYEHAPWPPALVEIGEGGDRVRALHQVLRDRHVVGEFTALEDLAVKVTRALAGYLGGSGGDPVPPTLSALGTVPPPQAWLDYYRRLEQSYAEVELDALTHARPVDSPRVPLADVFVEPTAREDADQHAGGRVRGAGSGPSVPRPRTSDEVRSKLLFDLVVDQKHRALVLLGDPGSGKTAVARFLALRLSGAADSVRLAPFDGRRPLLVELRSYADFLDDPHHGGETFVDYLDLRSRMGGLGVPRDELVAYLAGGGPVMAIFDGLDEIYGADRRERAAEQIADFASTYPAARVLVTARTIGYSRARLSGAGFHHVTMEDFREPQIADFVGRWCDAVPGDTSTTERLRRRLLDAVRDVPAIRDLAGNPLLLCILAVTGWGEELPRGRWQVYENAAAVLIERWGAGGAPKGDDELAAIDVEAKTELLGRVALRMRTDRADADPNFIGRPQLFRVVEDYLMQRYEYPRGVASRLANGMIEQLHHRDILRRNDGHTYGFAHRAFLEFFFVQAVLPKIEESDPDWSPRRLESLFRDHWADPSWREVLLLLVNRVHPALAGRLIVLLATEVNRPWPLRRFEDPPWNLALAARCLAELDDPGTVPEAAEAVLRQVILLIEHGLSGDDPRVNALAEAEILPVARMLGPRWPGRLHYLQWYQRRGIMVSWRAGSVLATRLAVLLAEPREQIEDALNDALGAMGDRQARRTVIAGLAESAALPLDGDNAGRGRREQCRVLLELHARGDVEGAMRLAAVETLIASFRDDRLRDLLAERVDDANENYAEARLAAARALAAGYLDDPRVRDTLFVRAREDPEGRVRAAVVAGLADRDADRDGIGALLVDRIRQDMFADTIEAAVAGLVRWSVGPTRLRELLTERIDAHPDPVRRVVGRLLGGLPHDPETHRRLLDLLRSDPDARTRLAVLQTMIAGMPAAAELRAILIERIHGDEEPSLRLVAQRALVTCFPADAEVGAVLARQAEQDTDSSVRQAAVIDLATYPAAEDAKDIVIRHAVDDPAAVVRLAAYNVLADRFGAEPDTRRAIVQQATNEHDTIVRLTAVRELTTVGGGREIHHHLLDRVGEDPDPQVVRAAANALARVGAYRSQVVATLFERAHNAHAAVREAAISVLVSLPDRRDDLRRLLLERARDDGDPAVIRAAVTALVAEFGGAPELEDILLAEATADYSQIRVVAIELLGAHFAGVGRIRDTFLERAKFETDVEVRRAITNVLGRIEPDVEIRDLLFGLVVDDDWSIRSVALQVLGTNFADDPDVHGLIRRLVRTDPDERFRLRAVQALTCLPDADPDDLPDAPEHPSG